MLVPKGQKRSDVGYQRIGVTIPDGIYAEMIGVIEAEKRWFDRVEFIREAIREKVATYRREHPQWQPPAKERR